MRLMNFAILGCAMAMLAACATPPPISSNPVQTAANAIGALPIGGPIGGNTVVTGLQNAAFNLDSAIQIGILPATDAADGCVHGALQTLGADVTLANGMENPVMGAPVAKQFTPKVSDLLSGGSVAYILAVQAKALAGGGITVPAGCEQLVGHFVLTGVNAPAAAIVNSVAGALP